MSHILVTDRGFIKADSYSATDHTVEFVVNDGEVDRMGDTLHADGAFLAPHVNLMDHHMMDGPSITKVLGVVEPGSLRTVYKKAVARARFDQDNQLALLAEKMVGSGTLSNVSVGFEPFEYRRKSDPDATLQKRKLGDPPPFPWDGPFDITKWEFRELSLVGVPASPNSLARFAKAFGVPFEAEDGEPIEMTLERFVARVADEVMERLAYARGEPKRGKLAGDWPSDDLAAWLAAQEG
jgi:hypothetical protein